MKLYYFKEQNGNFGDDLNEWLWPKLIPGVMDDDDSALFIGIGTIINDLIPGGCNKIVFGSGVGYLKFVPRIDESWKIFCLRGPLSARALGVDSCLAVTDAAILLRNVFNNPCKKKTRISFMPHAIHANSELENLCSELGVGYISARWPVEKVLTAVAQTECLVTEAMHGAIAADVLRVPWIPVYTTLQMNPFKWEDWCQTINVSFEPTKLDLKMQSRGYECKSQNPLDIAPLNLKGLSQFKQGFSKIVRSSKRNLSSDARVDGLTKRMNDLLGEFKEFIRKDGSKKWPLVPSKCHCSTRKNMLDVYLDLAKDFSARSGRMMIKKYVSLFDYGHGTDYLDHEDYAQAAKCFSRAIRNHPLVGRDVLWTRYQNTLYRLLKPYLALAYCILRKYWSSILTLRKATRTNDAKS